MDIVFWSEFPTYEPPKLRVYKGNEQDAARQAEVYLEEGADVIYFYAKIDTITLKEKQWQ